MIKGDTGPLALVLKIPALVFCLVIGLKCLESLVIYNVQAGFARGLSGHHDLYNVAIVGQLLNLGAFAAIQLIGGVILRSLIGQNAQSRAELIQSVLRFSLGFAFLTGLIVTVIVLGNKVTPHFQQRVGRVTLRVSP